MPVTVTILPLTLPTPLVGTDVMRDVGDLAVRLIRTHTEAGTDKHGAAFQPYTPAYAAKKSAEVGAGTVNLTLSGRMLNDMAVTDVGPNRVSVGFRSSGGRGTGQTMIQRSRSVGAEDKARWHDEDGAGKRRVKREFFGLTSAEQAKIVAVLDRYLDTIASKYR